MKPGSFKSIVESLAEHMANVLKTGGPEAARATKKQMKPMYEAPEKSWMEQDGTNWWSILSTGSIWRNKPTGRRHQDKVLRSFLHTVLLTWRQNWVMYQAERLDKMIRTGFPWSSFWIGCILILLDLSSQQGRLSQQTRIYTCISKRRNVPQLIY